MIAAVRERPPVTEVGMLGAAMTTGGLVAVGLLIWSLVDCRRHFVGICDCALCEARDD